MFWNFLSTSNNISIKLQIPFLGGSENISDLKLNDIENRIDSREQDWLYKQYRPVAQSLA